MKTYPVNFQTYIKVAFWRAATFMTGVAVRNRRTFHRILWVSPIVLAAIAAFLLGKVFGNLLLWSLSI